MLKCMTVRNSAQSATVSRIGQRRQVVIPKRVFDALQLQEGDFVEVTVERGRLAMRPKRLVDVGDVSHQERGRKGAPGRRTTQSRPLKTVAQGKT